MHFLLSQCQVSISEHGSILLTMFLAGLVGGTTHCAGMCGPFVMAQVRCGGTCETTLQKLSGAALLPYHFGRMTTYIFLGSIAAFLSKQIIDTPFQKEISVLFLSIAGLVFIASAMPRVNIISGMFRSVQLIKIGKILGKISKPLLVNPKNFRGYGLGVLLGFLPCGLIFAALMAVSTTGSIITAMVAMSLFTIGTFPAMFLVGIGSGSLYKKWPYLMQSFARVVMVVNGLSLFMLAGNILK